jgi:hypothetical protein
MGIFPVRVRDLDQKGDRLASFAIEISRACDSCRIDFLLRVDHQIGVWLSEVPLPGIKGEARRAAPDRPLGRALLERHQQNFGGRVGGIKRLNSLLFAHPAVGRCPVYGV